MSGQISSVNLLALQEQLHDEEGTRRRLALRLEATRAAVEQAQHALAAAQLEQRLLEAQLLEKDRVLAIQRRLVSPISILPHDTLLEIFYRLQSTAPEDWYPKRRYATRMAYLLASVSKEWRRVVLSTPRMWSNIYFDFSDFEPPLDESWDSRAVDARQPRCRALHLELERSMKAPLDVHIDRYDPRRPGELLYGSTFRRIMDTAARWRTFSLCVDTLGIGNHCILHHFQAPTPLLERIEISLSGVGYLLSEDDDTLHAPCEPQRPVHFLPCAPRLRAMEIDDRIVEHISSARPSKLSTLKLIAESDFVSCLVPTYELACLLSNLGSLEYLDINALPDTQALNQGKPHPAVVLPHLRTLQFTNSGVSILTTIATALLMPYLQTLSVGRFSGTAAELVFFKACATITRLSITGTRVVGLGDGGQLSQLIGCLPSLQSMSLNFFSFSGEDFDSLAEENASARGWLCPKLTAICLTQARFCSTNTTSSFLAFVTRRTTGEDGVPAKLTRVSVEGRSVPLWLTDIIKTDSVVSNKTIWPEIIPPYL